eukprot:scaffold5773_cov116-Isochrysis_galbana.AAC.3
MLRPHLGSAPATGRPACSVRRSSQPRPERHLAAVDGSDPDAESTSLHRSRPVPSRRSKRPSGCRLGRTAKSSWSPAHAGIVPGCGCCEMASLWAPGTWLVNAHGGTANTSAHWWGPSVNDP